MNAEVLRGFTTVDPTLVRPGEGWDSVSRMIVAELAALAMSAAVLRASVVGWAGAGVLARLLGQRLVGPAVAAGVLTGSAIVTYLSLGLRMRSRWQTSFLRRQHQGGERRKLWSLEILVGLGCKTER